MKKLLFCLFLFCTFSSVFCQNVRVRQNSFQKVSVSFATDTLQVDNVSRTEGTFSAISMDGYFPSNNPGDPQLPVFSRMLQIPVCDSVVATVTNSQYTEYDAADLGITHPLYPSQPSLPKTQVAQFTYNQSVYQTNAFYALPLVSVEKAGVKRNYALANVYVSPVQYNPVTRKIRIYTQIDVEFTFVNTDMAKTNRLQMFNSPMFSLDNNVVINKMNSTRVEFADAPIKYMIVANSMFEANVDFQAFIAWKRRLGYLVEVTYVQNGTSTSAIKSIVQDEYDNATTADPAPTFLLLVGDIDQVPTFISRDDNYDAFPTDLYYATLEGSDNLPDCYYGRLSATGNTQLSNQLEKIMMYEQYTMPDPSYLGKAVLVAGIDDYFSEGHSNTHANGQINYINQYYVNANSSTHSYSTVYKHNYPYTDVLGEDAAPSIISEISNGVGFANYTAHGYTDEWSLPHFGTDNIPSLANTNKYGLLIGNCCLSGKFDESECFGEALLRASQKGAMGYIGASKETIWDCDYYWAVGVRSTIQNGTSYNASNLGMYDRLFHTHGEMQSVWVSTIGGMIQAGDMAVQYSTQSYYKKYYWEIYHCLGDPSVRVYLGLPKTMTVTASNTINPGDVTYSATVAPYSYVALKLDDTTFVTASFADENGEVTLTLPSDIEEGDYELVALAQNYIPYFQDVTMEIPNCPYPKNLTVSDITPYTARFSWTDGGGTYNLEVKEGDDDWTSLATSLNANTYQLTNLPDNTDFQVRVQSVCGADVGTWKTTSFSTPEACPTPTGLACTFNGTSANLTWTENGSATTWVVQYGSQNDFAAGSYAEVTVTGTPSATLTGLKVNSIYYARVKSDCGSLYGESPWSDICEFTVPNRITLCEDFEGYAATAYDVAGVVPDGWSIIFTGDSLNYAPHVATGINHDSIIANGNGFCFTAGRDEYWSYNSYGDYCYAVLPAYEGYPQNISFKYRFFDATTGNLNVGYITDATDASTFVSLKNVLGSADQGSEASYSLTNYNIPAGARLAFRWGQLGRLTTCGIDEVCVAYAYNQCFDMTEVTVSDVMLHSAQLSFEGSASSYNLRYRLIATSNNDNTDEIPSASWVMVEGVTSPYTLQGLTVESTYEVMAQAVCGEEELGEWSSAVSFTTPGICETPGNLAASNEKNTSVDLAWTGVQSSYDLVYRIAPHPGKTLYFSGFETYDDLYDWAAIDYDEDGYYWSYYNNSANEVPAHDGSGSMYSISLDPGSGEPLHTDDWLISPQMVLGDSVSFWVRNHGMSDVADSFMVFVLFENEEDLDVIDVSPLEVATTDYVKYTVSLAPYTGEYGYIAIEHLGGAQLYLSVDDFRVFNSDTLGGDWQTVENVSSPYHLTGLTPDTEYEWYVVGKNCDGEGTMTEQSQTSMFTTPEACPRPTNLVVNSNLTMAEVSWEGSSEIYHLRYRVTIDGDTTSDHPWIMVDSVSSPYVINGLNTNTTYRVEVQSDCDEFLSDWNTYADFATLDPCGEPTNLDTSNVTSFTADLSWSGVQETYHVQYRVAGSDPVLYFEDFESDPIQNGDWTTIDYDGDGYDWFVSDEGGLEYSYCAASYVWESIGRRNLNPDNWLITPRIQLKDTLKVWLRGDGPYYPNDHFAIYATTDEPTVYNFLHFGTVLIPETITNYQYVEYTADLSEFQGWMGYIAIRHFNDSTMYRLDVDNFGIYGPDVSPGEWVDTIVTGNTLHLTGLSQMTDYEWRVKGICEEGETEWVDSTFSTPYYCEPLTDFTIEYTGGTDATISWTPENESARVMVNGNVNVLNWEFSPHSLYFLDTNTVYTVSLQRNCGGGHYSDWIGPKTFITDCSSEDKCELTFVLKDKGDDGWDGNAILVKDAVSGNVIATMTNEDLNGTQNWGQTEVNVKTLSVCDGRELQFVWDRNFIGYTNEISYEVYDVNEQLIFSGSGAGGGLPFNYTVSCEPHNCRKPHDLTAENITTTTANLSWDCSIDLEDYTVRYRTAGGINPVIYEEGFENGLGDWTTLDCYYLTHITDDTLYRVHTGQHAFSFSYNDESSTVNPQYLISSELPEIGEGTNLEFYYKSRSEIFSGYFQLGFSSTDNDTSSFTFRDTLFAHDGIWLHYNENIPAGTKYICWKFAADDLVLAIDDIRIGTDGTAGEWQTVTATETSTTLTGLMLNHIYNVQVKSNCDGPELWSDTLTFSTLGTSKVYQIVNTVTNTATQMTWNQFVDKVYNGEFFSTDKILLMEDISASTMAGTFDNPFISTFDGRGNTITFNYNGTVQGIAPFHCINGATIKNLAVEGTITTSAHHAGGLVGFADNTSPDVASTIPGVVNTIENCHVSVNISSSFGRYIGGIVGHAKCVTTNIIGCVYDGTLMSTGYKGGMIGWADWATINITNSFFKGNNAGDGKFDPVACKTHIYNNQTDETTLVVALSNYYYNTDGNFSSTDDHAGLHNATLTGSGKHAYSVTGEDGVTVLMAGNSNTIYDVSGITAYDKGIVYKDTIYGGEEEEIALNLSGSSSGLYEADYGTLTGTANPYMLTMSGHNTLISALPCPLPNDLTVSDITTSSANLSWTGEQDSYHVQYRVAATTTSGEWKDTVVTGTFIRLAGLIPGTLYDLRLQGICGESVTEWASDAFTTAPAPEITATNTEQTITYGDSIDTVTVTYSNATLSYSTLPAGLTFDPTENTLTGAPEAVGDYTITFTATATTGENVTQDVHISAASRALTITLDTVHAYDGANLVSVYAPTGAGYTVEGLVEGDMITAGTVTSPSMNAGTYTDQTGDNITIGFQTEKGIANYAVTYNFTQTITRRGISITGSAEKAYDGTPLELTYDQLTVTNMVEGESLTGGRIYTESSNVGVYTCSDNSFNYMMDLVAIQESFEVDPLKSNYAPEFDVTLTITAQALTITANSAEKVYDGSELTETGYTVEGLAATDALTATTSGTQTCVGESANTIGSYTVTRDGDDMSGNYTITTVEGTLKVTAVTAGLTCPTAVTVILKEGMADTALTPATTGTATFDPEALSLPATVLEHVTIKSDLDELNPLAAGTHTITWTLYDECNNAMLTCEQAVTIEYLPCEGTITMADATYHYQRIGSQCWFTENLREQMGEHHAYQEDAANLEKFGYLYSWYTAVGVAEGDINAAPEVLNADDGTGYVQGICPAGWAIPSRRDVQILNTTVGDADLLKEPSTEYWLPGHEGLGGSGFNARAGGLYNDARVRYENLLAEFHFWMSEAPTGTTTVLSACIAYHCDHILLNEPNFKSDLKSIRCIRKKVLEP